MLRKQALSFLFVSLLFTLSSAAQIKFTSNKAWKDILATAKKENKLIFMDAYATWCGPCQWMQENVFPESQVGSYFNKSFINVKMDMEEGEGLTLAEKYNVTSYPTFLFINGDGEILHKSIGAMESPAFITLGKAATDPSKQYYTLMKKAETASIDPTTFLQWIKMAEEMEDDDAISETVKKYMATKKYPLFEKQMLTIALDHADHYTEAEFAELHKNKARIISLTGRTEEEVDNSLERIIVTIALINTTEEEDFKAADFKSTVAKYYPKEADRYTQEVKARYYKALDNHTLCLEAVSALLTTPEFKLTGAEMATMMIDYSEIIVKAQRTTGFMRLVNNFKLQPAESDHLYYKDLGIWALYVAMEDTDKVIEYSKKIIDNPKTPEDLRNRIKEVISE